jgi:predicted nuclease of restriction endonuclease-like (RecB) superfamily
MTNISQSSYMLFLNELKHEIKLRQYNALRAVNRELTELYWYLGCAIFNKQEKEQWGRAVVKTIAKDLQDAFPGRNGFSNQNLWLMRQFYIEYKDNVKLQTLVKEISWSKNVIILGRCKENLEKEFYLRATARFGWTKDVLKHQIDNDTYKKYLLNQTNFDKTLPESVKSQALLAVKDHYTFDVRRDNCNDIAGKASMYLEELYT